MGAWGPGVFDNDDAQALLDRLSGQNVRDRTMTLVQILHSPPHDLDYWAWLEDPGEIIGAIAVVAAGLPQGDTAVREIVRQGHASEAILVPEDPVLADDALAALLVVAGHDPRAPRDGAWHFAWPDAQTAERARQTTDELVEVFHRYQHRHEQEVPPEWLTFPKPVSAIFLRRGARSGLMCRRLDLADL